MVSPTGLNLPLGSGSVRRPTGGKPSGADGAETRSEAEQAMWTRCDLLASSPASRQRRGHPGRSLTSDIVWLSAEDRGLPGDAGRPKPED